VSVCIFFFCVNRELIFIENLNSQITKKFEEKENVC